MSTVWSDFVSTTECNKLQHVVDKCEILWNDWTNEIFILFEYMVKPEN